MRKIGDDEFGFLFAKISKENKYKQWACEMQYLLESARLWDYTLMDKENPEPTLIVMTGKDPEVNLKLK